METKYLRKTKGYSIEDIREALNGKKIQYEMYDIKPSNHFRKSLIILERKDRKALVRKIGHGRGNYFKEFYYAEYDILPNFDFSQLHGILTFHNGRLVESTEIRYQNYLAKSAAISSIRSFSPGPRKI